MKAIAKEEVVRYHIEFDLDEVETLRAIGFLPPNCAIPARMWLTGKELFEVIEMVYGKQAKQDLVAMLNAITAKVN